jgi:hypothetical protein
MFFLADSSPEFDVGYKAGTALGLLIPVAVLLYAFRSLHDEGRSRKCALSLVLFSAGWACTTLGYALSKWVGAMGLLVVAAIVGFLCVIGAVVLAIMGLVDVSVDSNRKTGAIQAVVSLVLSGLFVLVGLVGFLTGDRGVPDDWKMAQPLPGSRVSVVPKNFSLAVPGPDWVQVIPTKLNPKADVAFVHPKKMLYVMLVAHDIPAANLTPLKLFSDAARGEMKQMDPAAQIGEAQPLTAGGCPGMVFDAEVKMKNMEFSYREFIGVHGSRAYQLVVWSLRPNSSLMRREADRIIGSFEVLAK